MFHWSFSCNPSALNYNAHGHFIRHYGTFYREITWRIKQAKINQWGARIKHWHDVWSQSKAKSYCKPCTIFLQKYGFAVVLFFPVHTKMMIIANKVYVHGNKYGLVPSYSSFPTLTISQAAWDTFVRAGPQTWLFYLPCFRYCCLRLPRGFWQSTSEVIIKPENKADVSLDSTLNASGLSLDIITEHSNDRVNPVAIAESTEESGRYHDTQITVLCCALNYLD